MLTDRRRVAQGFSRLINDEVVQEYILDLKSEEHTFTEALMSPTDAQLC